MATIIPFKGIRPTRDKAHLVASRSVDGYSATELLEKLKSNPYAFLHIVNPDFRNGEKTKSGSEERLQKVKSTYLEFVKEKIFTSDIQPSYYIYQQHKDDDIYTGIIGCTSIDDYFNGVIKIHEQTLTEREEKLKHYLEVCDFNAEPVLFSYPDDKVIDELTLKLIRKEPLYDFSTTDKVHHKLWIVDNSEQITKIQEQFSKIPAIYIADGHHRSASSALLGKSRREKNPDYTGKEPYNFYLGVFFPESQLKIVDFNRVVKDLNGLSLSHFMDKLSDKFIITEKGTAIYKPLKKHNFSMYLEGKWYSLDAKKEIIHPEDPVGSLDAFILTEHLLSPILDIHDLKTDKRIGFVSGIKGMEELQNQVGNQKF